MSLYIGLVHKDPDSSYGMSFPDAPGCFSAADTPEQIYKMAREALTLWLEGMLEDGLPFQPRAQSRRSGLILTGPKASWMLPF